MSNSNDFDIQNGRLVRYSNVDEEIVDIPDGVETICKEAFAYRYGIKRISIPSSVKYIEESAFSAPRNLECVCFSDMGSFLNISFDGSVWSWDAGPDLYINGELVTDIIIPEGVTNIGNYAFEGWRSLKSITIPDSVARIGDHAFYNCRNLDKACFSDLNSFLKIKFGDSVWSSVNLYFEGEPVTEITIPEDVTSIDGNLFCGIKNITSILIPNTVTIDGNFKFTSCDSLTNITIPEGTTSIVKDAFFGCSSLTEITIPDGVTCIEESAFSYCKSLTNIVIPDSVVGIGAFAFRFCSSLKNIKIPCNLERIGFCTFGDCESLNEVVIPTNVKCIEEHAFGDCKNLKNIVIPDSVINIENEAFKGCDSLAEITIPTKYLIEIGERVFSPETVVILSKYIEGIEKHDISQRLAFKETPIQDIKSTIAKRVAVNGFLTVNELSIYDEGVIDSYKKFLKGKLANYRDFIKENNTELIIRRLASLNLLDGKFIDKMMDMDLSDKEKELLQEGNSNRQKDKSGKAYSSTSKKAPTISELKKTWSYKQNEEGITITSYKDIDTIVTVPEMIGKDTVTVIGKEAFSPGKSGLNDRQRNARSAIKAITLPQTIGHIEWGAFRNCYNLTDFSFPERVNSIESKTFENCRCLENVTIPNGIISIGNCAFKGCTNLTSIVIPDSTTIIDSSAFEECSQLSDVTFSNRLEEIRYGAFKKCSGLIKVTIPDSVIKIYGGAFEECSNLQSVVLPNGLEKIEFFVFYRCNGLTDITIPESVKSIDENAFKDCDNLTIHAPQGSIAEEYAKNKGITFEAI